MVNKFSLNEKTIAVWRTRGAIPDKYSKTDAPVNKVSTLQDKRTAQRIIEVLSNDKLNIRKIGELCGIEANRMQDIRRGKTYITEEELLELKKVINRLKLSTAKSIACIGNRMRVGSASFNDLFTFSKLEEIKLFIVLKQDKQKYESLKWAATNKTELSAPVAAYVRDCLDILILELNL